jgi:hypothetical protein
MRQYRVRTSPVGIMNKEKNETEGNVKKLNKRTRIRNKKNKKRK